MSTQILHLSIPARHPRRVADVLGELWNGRSFPFPPSPDSYVVFAGDEGQGTCIEVYPLGTELIPGTKDEPVQVHRTRTPSQFCEVHAAISVLLSWEQIEAIAQREQWRAVKCDRGAPPFAQASPKEKDNRGSGCYQLVEFWVENRFLLELFTPQMSAQYRAFMTPQNWENFFDLELWFNASSKHFAYKSRL